MGHSIIALLTPHPCSPEAAQGLGLVPVVLTPSLVMFHIDHHFSMYQQVIRQLDGDLAIPEDFPCIFPREAVLSRVVTELTGRPDPLFVLLMTEYFGGMGDQWAVAFRGPRRIPAEPTINAALRAIGIVRKEGLDEFDTVGLSRHRAPPDHLRRFGDLCAELGL